MKTIKRAGVTFFLLCLTAPAFGQEGRLLHRKRGATPEPRAATPLDEPAPRPLEGERQNPQKDWLLGKIEPSLEALYRAGGDLEVVMYLQLPPGMESPQEVKARHLPEIRALARQVRDIDRAYRPDDPVSDDGEELLQDWLMRSVSLEDEARRLELNEELDDRLSAMRSDVRRAMERRAAVPHEKAAHLVESLGGKVLARIVSVNALEATIPAGALLELAADPLVRAVTTRPVDRPQLNNSVHSAGFAVWHSAGYFGATFDAGVVDSGVQADHPAFFGLNFATDGSPLTDVRGHGTHVAGIIASRDGLFQGTAWGLDTLFHAKAAPGFADFDDLMDTTVTGVADTPEVINYSQGSVDPATDVDYSLSDAFYDAFIENFGVMVVNSAGNSGWGTTTIVHPATIYNSLVVANMDDMNDVTRVGDVRNPGSSVGPTLNGRKKPDITAPGTNIASTNAHWSDVANEGTCDASGAVCSSHADCVAPDFCSFSCGGTLPGEPIVECSGTSMAAPHVAGAIVLLVNGGNVEPMSQKAVLINTAATWSSRDTEDPSDDGETGGAQWDKSYGWGYLAMGQAYFNRADYFTDSVVPRNDNATEDDYKLYKGPMLVDDKVTLVWMKRSIYGVADIPGSDQFDLSDLNIRLYDEDTGDLEDSTGDVDDSVEQVHSSIVMNAVVKIEAKSTSFDGVASEEFAVATEEGFVEADFPVNFTGGGSFPGTIDPGAQADFSAFVINNSGLASHNNTLDLQTLPPGWSLVSGADAQDVGTAEANGASGLAVWRLQARAADTTPPSPSPLEWSSEPFELDQAELRMRAVTATDDHGPVEYLFDFGMSPTGGAGGSDSGWQTSALFTDTGLETNHQYCYRTRARDVLPATESLSYSHSHTSYDETFGPDGPWEVQVQINNETPNEGMFSATSCDYTAIDAPAGIQFGTITSTSIAARASTTPAGLTRGSSGLILYRSGGVDSGWKQNNDPWTAGALTPNTSYGFQAQARNGDATTTATSPVSFAVTHAALPVAGALNSSAETTIQVTWGANGNPAGTQYLVENVTLGTDSGWTTNLGWQNTGLTCGDSYQYRVKARNQELVETAWVALGSLAAGPDFDGDAFPNCVDPDDDNDNVPDASDCSPFNDELWATPSQARAVTLSHTGGAGGTTTMTWLAPIAPGTSATVAYDTVITADAGLWGPGDALCHDTGTDLVSTHTTAPPPGSVIYFLSRPVNACGDGNPGSGMDAGAPLPRTVRSCS